MSNVDDWWTFCAVDIIHHNFTISVRTERTHFKPTSIFFATYQTVLISCFKWFACNMCNCYCFTSAVVTCPHIKKVEGEMYKDTTCTSVEKVYNDKCEVSCTFGYNLTRIDSVRRCTENGTWSNDVTCERMLC